MLSLFWEQFFYYVWRVLKHVSCSFIHWKACSLDKRLSHLGLKPAILLSLPHYPRAALLPTEITGLLGQISVSKCILWTPVYNAELTKNSIVFRCECMNTVQWQTPILFYFFIQPDVQQYLHLPLVIFL